MLVQAAYENPEDGLLKTNGQQSLFPTFESAFLINHARKIITNSRYAIVELVGVLSASDLANEKSLSIRSRSWNSQWAGVGSARAPL